MINNEDTGLTWQQAYATLESGIARLVGEASGTAAMVVRGDGQLLTWAGGLSEPASLGALAAGSMAAGEALLSGVDDRGRRSIFVDGDTKSVFLQAIDAGALLVVVFDRRSSLGLVRLRARRLVEEARPALAGLWRDQAVAFEALDDEEIDALFSESAAPG